MSILVTGGTGLIGTQVVTQLAAAGRPVVAPTRRPPEGSGAVSGVEYVRADIRDEAAVVELARRNAVEGIVHLAALLDVDCERDPDAAVAVNVQGTLNLLRAAREAGVRRFVFGSSIAVYGDADVVFGEDTPPAPPVRLYGQTKAMGETLALRYRALHGLDVVSLRYGGVYGPGGPAERTGMSAQRHALKRTLWGEDATLAQADGQERFQFTYSKDAAAATVQALDAPALRHTVYNVAGPVSDYISLADFYRLIREVAPKPGRARFAGRSKSGLRVSIDRLVRDLGYTPRFTVRQGLQDELGRT